IGENGVLLSGGQRQRVAIARAFYHEREIIIMDEATSSLDNETEREVINSIKKLHGIKTLIVIAHRLSTIQYCDVVYKLEKGKIIAHGHFDEVVSASVGGDK
ncbi:MAG: ABC transporter ATP-binding protein, partial [uncultured bacterium]